MSCTCKESASVSENAGSLYFSFEKSILLANFTTTIKHLKLKSSMDGETMIVEADSLNKVLCNIVDATKRLLEAEREAIKVLPLKEGEKLNFEAITKTKSLQEFSDLYKSDFLLDVLDNQALTTHFQPIVDVRNKKIYGYECLIRGVKKDGSLLYPDVLFEAAQRTRLTFNLDRQARETSLKTGAVKKIKEHLFINFLPTTIYNPETCLQDTFKWAKSLEYDYSKLVFEVVETEKINDFDHLAYILSYYKKQGVKTALDDVGAGFSNLNALIKLQPDIIKIDREIIDGIHADKLKQSVFEALVKIAKENSITVLAEGVETQEEYKYVLEHGTDLVQGYYFAKPNNEPIRSLSII